VITDSRRTVNQNIQSRKILYLTPGCFDKGGISRYSRYQIEALRTIHGHDRIRVLSLLGPDANGFETHFDTTWHGGSSRATTKSRMGLSVEAAKQAMLWRPDVIHCAHVNFAPLVSRLAMICNANTVLNVYGLELWSGLSPTRAAHMRRMDHVIADCHATALHVRESNLHAQNPTVIWDCADLDRFHPGPIDPRLLGKYGLPDPGHKRVVLTFGRLSKSARHKGYDRLIEIFGDVRATMPKAHLIIAGRGDDKERLEAKAHDHGLADCVTFTGAIDEEDLAAIYRVAHVFCLVSDKGPGRGEGIPLTPIEAMASGLPIIVGGEDGSREAIDGTRNGMVVSPRDLPQMTDALVTLLTETDVVRETRTAEARKVAEERFSYAAFVEKHAAFYRGLAASDGMPV
jgi:phosphatidyl-myo-inositol dimannoside synthase